MKGHITKEQLSDNLKQEIESIGSQLEHIENSSVLFEDVKTTKYRDKESNTTYWLTEIPNTYKMNVGLSEYYEKNYGTHENDGFGTDYENNPKLERCSDFAKRTKASVVINGGIWGDTGFIGQVIVNGVKKTDSTTNYYTMGINDNNKIVFFPPKTTYEKIISSGIKNCVSGFVPVVIDGEKASDEILNLYVGGNTTPNPRNCIGQKTNGDIIILTCDGRAKNENGMLLNDLARLMLKYGACNAYNLDGGGSSSIVVNGVLQNIAIDNYRTQERKVANFIYFKKDSAIEMSNDIITLSYEVEKLKRQIDNLNSNLFYLTDLNNGYMRLLGEKGFTLQGIESWDGENKNTKLILSKDYLHYWDYIDNNTIFQINKEGVLKTRKGVLGNFYNTVIIPEDCNNITENGFYWTNGSIPNSGGTGALLHIQLNSSSAIQYLFSWHENYQNKRRRKSEGKWGEWI